MSETPDRDARNELHQAVFVARQHRLVSAHTLDLAGFRPAR